MRFRIRPITVLLSSIALLTAALPASARELRIGGTGSVTEAMRKLAPAFESETGIKLTILPSLGTTGANNALMDGKLGLAVGGAICATRRRRGACRCPVICARPSAS